MQIGIGSLTVSLKHLNFETGMDFVKKKISFFSIFCLLGISLFVANTDAFGAASHFSGTGDKANPIYLEAGLWFVTFSLTTPSDKTESVELDLIDSAGDLVERIFDTDYTYATISAEITKAIEVPLSGNYILEVDTYTGNSTVWEIEILAGSEVTPIDPPDDRYSFSGKGTQAGDLVHLEAGLWFVTFNLTTPINNLEGVDLDLKDSFGDLVERIFDTDYSSDAISTVLTKAIEVPLSGDYVLEIDTYTEYYTDWEIEILAGSEVTPIDPPDDRYSFSGKGTRAGDLVHLEAGLWFVTFNLTTPINNLEGVDLDLKDSSGDLVERIFDTDYSSDAISTVLTKAIEVPLSGDYVLEIDTYTEYYTDWEIEILAGSEVTPIDPPDDRYSFSGKGTQAGDLVHLEAGLWFVTFNLTTPINNLEGVDLDLKDSSGDLVERIFDTDYSSDAISTVLTKAIEVPLSGDYVLEIDTYTEYYTDWEIEILAGSEVTPIDPPDDRYSFSGKGTQAGDLVHLEAGLWFVTFNLTTPVDNLECVDLELLNDSGGFFKRLFDIACSSDSFSTVLTKSIDISTAADYILQVETYTEYFTVWSVEIYRLNAFPICNTKSAGSIGYTSAILNGEVNPNGSITQVTFQYGKSSSYGNEIIATPNPLSGNSFQLITAQIGGLDDNTTYHFRVHATNSEGTASGSDFTFTTLSRPQLFVSETGDCGVKTPCFDSIQDAIDNATTGSVILVKQGTYEGSLNVDGERELLIRGGFNSTYDQQTANTTFIHAVGPMTIKASSGSLRCQMINVK